MTQTLQPETAPGRDIESAPVSAADLDACSDARFVEPGERWQAVSAKLLENRGLILTGEPGTGRRTAALRLLRGVCPAERIYEFEPLWSRPRAEAFPAPVRGSGYLVDMTEPAAQPAPRDFGQQLMTWAKSHDVYLIVTTTDEAGEDWTSSAPDAVVRPGSPDAKLLTERELRAAHADGRVGILEDAAFAPIWESKPNAADACRLAGIIRTVDALDAARIIEEYDGWRGWIDEALPETLDGRALFWSCAFCDGGRQTSVLGMAERLRLTLLKESRKPAEVLTDNPSSRRLRDAHAERAGDRVKLAPGRQGMAAAVRRHLWDEFAGQRELLAGWALEQVATLPADDAELVIDAVLDLVIHYKDDELLTRLRDALAEEDLRGLGGRALSTAALDPRYGAHVRARLYHWLDETPSPGVVGLVALACGGPYGEKRADQAILRLRRAARQSQPDSETLAAAITAFAAHHPRELLGTIASWFAQSASSTEGINAFLALASREDGAKLLCGKDGRATKDPGFRSSLAAYLRAALDSAASRERANRVLDTWARFAESLDIEEETAAEICGEALEPSITDPSMQRFLAAREALSRFWQRVVDCARRQATAAADAPRGTLDDLLRPVAPLAAAPDGAAADGAAANGSADAGQ